MRAADLLLRVFLWGGFTLTVSAAARGLDPGPNRVIHLAGQSPDEFANYSNFVDATRPLAYSFYRGLIEFQNSSDAQNDQYWKNVAALLVALGQSPNGTRHIVIPHIAVHLAYHDGTKYSDLNKKTLGEIANTDKYQKSIVALVKGLEQHIRSPVFLRLGYEFNGAWNGYTPAQNYKKVWRKIHNELLKYSVLRRRVALVWDATCNVEMSLQQWEAWYPGDDIVDWWGVNVLATGDPVVNQICNGYNPADPTNRTALHTMTAFLDAASARGFPVLLAEVMNRGIGTRLEQSWDAWFVPFFQGLVATHPAVRGFSYINRLSEVTKACNSVSGFWDQGCDGRIEASAAGVAEKYRHLLNTGELSHGIKGLGERVLQFVHAKSSLQETCGALGLRPQDCDNVTTSDGGSLGVLGKR